MVASKENKALDRCEDLATFLLRLTDNLPNIVPLKSSIEENLRNLRSAIQGLRAPRIMVIGRSGSGKPSLINAICGLKVAEVSDTKPETGMAEWKEYYHNGSDLLHILDTRGLQESEAPRQADPSKTPYDSIMRAISKECPDVILFLCKATEVRAATKQDLEICASVLTGIKKKYKIDPPLIGVLTKCDEVAPPKINLPTTDERKNKNIETQVKSFHSYLREVEKIRSSVKDVIPTVAYAEYEEGQNGLILPEEDMRWNIDELVQTLIKHTPKETRGSLARMANIEKFQLSVARTVVTACCALSGVAAANPIPGTALPVVGAIPGRETTAAKALCSG